MASLANWPEFSQAKTFKEIAAASFARQGKFADIFMKANYGEIKINQLRNFFGEIQSLEREIRSNQNPENLLRERVSLLEMNLAYDFGRNVITREFYDVMIQSLKKIPKVEDFKQFVVFVKSLIAYHKFHSKEKSL